MQLNESIIILDTKRTGPEYQLPHESRKRAFVDSYIKLIYCLQEALYGTLPAWREEEDLVRLFPHSHARSHHLKTHLGFRLRPRLFFQLG
jgi:hypothetical protein